MFKSLKELFRRMDLIKFLVVSQLKLAYQNMVFGYLWWLLTPMLWIFVYWLLISVIFQRGVANYPLFLACSILPWRAFTVSISQSVGSISGQRKIINQLLFPKGVFPISIVFSNSINLIFSIIVLIIAGYAYGVLPSVNLSFLPLIILTQLTFTMGLAFFLSIIGVYFLDIQNIMQFILRIWLYLSPALYDINRIPPRFRDIFMLNPFASIFISYRDVIIFGKAPPLEYLFFTFSVSFIILISGFLFFSSQEVKLAKAL